MSDKERLEIIKKFVAEHGRANLHYADLQWLIKTLERYLK